MHLCIPGRKALKASLGAVKLVLKTKKVIQKSTKPKRRKLNATSLPTFANPVIAVNNNL